MTLPMANQIHVMYVLKCEHVVMSAPNLISKSREIWCPICRNENTITGVHKYEWRCRCKTCGYSRWCGTSEELANRLADNHTRHTVHIGEAEYAVNPASLSELERLRRAKEI